MRVALGLTLVEYLAGDVLGAWCASVSLAPHVLLIVLSTLVVFRREWQPLLLLAGLLLNHAMNRMLKATLAHPRPLSTTRDASEYGMPSSHAQFSAFALAYFIYWLTHHHRWNDHPVLSRLELSAALALVLAVAYARVYLDYHTAPQVIVGLVLGFVVGWIYSMHIKTYISPRLPAWSRARLGRLFCLRDSTHIPNVWQFEYDNALAYTKEHAR
jgi:dolichyldiphosphatase